MEVELTPALNIGFACTIQPDNSNKTFLFSDRDSFHNNISQTKQLAKILKQND